MPCRAEIYLSAEAEGRSSECWSRNDSLGTWSTQGCKTVLTDASHTKCLCDRLSTFAILAQQPREIIMESSGAPSVTLIIGSGLSCLALVTLAVVYAALWSENQGASLHQAVGQETKLPSNT
uniref:Adhesion G protein-coupled receptor B3 n=1 Tax=Sphaerodactylus townsendi TaxID=933632 RepID=A0ACB8GD42_9SAUR